MFQKIHIFWIIRNVYLQKKRHIFFSILCASSPIFSANATESTDSRTLNNAIIFLPYSFEDDQYSAFRTFLEEEAIFLLLLEGDEKR